MASKTATPSIPACCSIRPTARSWLTYGSYFGYIRLVELDPENRQAPQSASARRSNIAINSEASILIHHDGWYYLLVTHGSCCAGANSTYNIRMGRSRKVTGPYLDNMGVDMLEGGGKLFAGSRGRHVGPGHFGLLDLGQGVQKFSLHYEADLDRGGVSVLDIRPLLVARRLAGGRRQSHRRHVRDRIRAHRHRAGTRRAGFAGRRLSAAPWRRSAVRPRSPPPELRRGPPIADQEPAQVAPLAGETRTFDSRPRCCRRNRNGRSRPSPNAGGYPGSPYFRISIAGTERALDRDRGRRTHRDRRSPARRNSCGGSISSPTAAIASARRRFRA